ncbi:hypothetical protein BVX97_06150 [bacterium E08(2017)]|nr:hypothetical protein BVX97_06150 [bacterium E08(2017)]
MKRAIILSIAALLTISSLATPLPETTPWNIEELYKPPSFEWSEGEQVRSLYYSSVPYKGKPTQTFAYYATPGTLAGDPSLDKNLPAIVLVHGGGGRAFSKWVELWASRGYAAIAMDLAGNGPGKKKLADGGPGQGHDMKFEAIDQPITDQWTYHAVANVIRAHSLIRSFPEVDPERTAITGISWGGYTTCIVAGIDNRFKAAVPVYGCGFLDKNSVWLKDFAKMSGANKRKWVQLWDPSQYVGSAAMPMLFVNGGTDFAYPPDSHAKTYSLVQTPKNLHFVPHLKHGHVFDKPKAIETFIQHHLEGKPALAKIGNVMTEGSKVTADFQASTKQVEAQLHYTIDKLPGDNKKRAWLSQPAKISGNKITSDLPPKEATIWFLTLKDERDTLVSSELQFNKTVKVFILAGQSNMVGHGKVENGRNPDYDPEDPKTKKEVPSGLGSLRYLLTNPKTASQYQHLADDAGNWIIRDDVWIYSTASGKQKGKLTTGFGKGAWFGPELGFGHIVGDHLDDPVLIIKTAWGGHSLGVKFRPPSSGTPAYTKSKFKPEDVGTSYREMMTIVKDVGENLETYFPELKGHQPEFAGFGWHQGWNDGCSKEMVAEYEVNMANFIRDVRKELGTTDLPFVIANTGMIGTEATGIRAELCEIQMAIGDPMKHPEFKGTVASVETRGFKRSNENSPSHLGYHWNHNAESHYLIGDAMGKAMIILLDSLNYK